MIIFRRIKNKKKSISIFGCGMVLLSLVVCLVIQHQIQSSQYTIEEKTISDQENLNKENLLGILYPYIVCETPVDKYSIINQTIIDEIVKHCSMSSEECSYEIDYEIKYQGMDYLSILFYGMQIPVGAAHPSDISWGVTFSMETAQLLKVTDFIELSDMQEKINNKEYVQVRGINIEGYEEIVGEEDWFQKYEELSLNYEDQNHNYDFYLTHEKLGILFGVSHAIGDYIIIEIER